MNQRPQKEGEEEPQKLSRKERKRLEAKLHAQHCGTRADAIAEHGVEALEGNELMTTQEMGFPLGIPLDVFENFVLPYCLFEDVRHLMYASPGIDALFRQRDDTIGRRVFNRFIEGYMKKHSYRPRPHPNEKFLAAADRLSELPKYRPITKTEQPTWWQSYEKRRKEHEAKREEYYNSEPSAEVRRQMKERTADWPSQTVEVYQKLYDGLPFAEYMAKKQIEYALLPPPETEEEPAKAKKEVVKSYLKLPSGVSLSDGKFIKLQLPKSEAFPNQYECDHHQIFFDERCFRFQCIDCKLVIAAPAKVSPLISRSGYSLY